MRSGTLHTILVLSICLRFQLSYSQQESRADVTQTSEIKRGSFMGQDCDDTEFRNSNGRPNWKNYGQWLSECDSMATVYNDKMFAERRAKQLEKERLAKEKELAEPLEDLDLDAMWENTVWNEIEDVVEMSYEVENITAVAGVRGAEAEDEALALLYYRRSMKGISKLELQKAFGKLKNKRDAIIKNEPNSPQIDIINKYLSNIEERLKRI